MACWGKTPPEATYPIWQGASEPSIQRPTGKKRCVTHQIRNHIHKLYTFIGVDTKHLETEFNSLMLLESKTFICVLENEGVKSFKINYYETIIILTQVNTSKTLVRWQLNDELSK